MYVHILPYITTYYYILLYITIYYCYLYIDGELEKPRSFKKELFTLDSTKEYVKETSFNKIV